MKKLLFILPILFILIIPKFIRASTLDWDFQGSITEMGFYGAPYDSPFIGQILQSRKTGFLDSVSFRYRKIGTVNNGYLEAGLYNASSSNQDFLEFIASSTNKIFCNSIGAYFATSTFNFSGGYMASSSYYSIQVGATDDCRIGVTDYIGVEIGDEDIGGNINAGRHYYKNYIPIGWDFEGGSGYILSFQDYINEYYNFIELTGPVNGTTTYPVNNLVWKWSGSLAIPKSKYRLFIQYGTSTSSPEYWEFIYRDSGMELMQNFTGEYFNSKHNFNFNTTYFAKATLIDNLTGNFLASSTWISFHTETQSQAIIRTGGRLPGTENYTNFSAPEIITAGYSTSTNCNWNGFWSDTSFEDLKCIIWTSVSEFASTTVQSTSNFFVNTFFITAKYIFPLNIFIHYNGLIDSIASTTPNPIILSVYNRDYILIGTSTIPTIENKFKFSITTKIDKLIYLITGLYTIAVSYYLLRQLKNRQQIPNSGSQTFWGKLLLIGNMFAMISAILLFFPDQFNDGIDNAFLSVLNYINSLGFFCTISVLKECLRYIGNFSLSVGIYEMILWFGFLTK